MHPVPVAPSIGTDPVVWFLAADAIGISEAQLLHELPPEEQARAARFMQPSKRLAWAAAHVALRRILSCALGCAAHDLHLATGPRGKPALHALHCSPLAFSLSHASSYVAIGMVPAGTVGIDIEPFNAHAAADISARVCCPDEYDPANLAPSFARAWTRKEAVLKALGVGLIDDLAGVHVGHLPLGTAGRVGDLQLQDLPAPTGYAASVCWGSGEFGDVDSRARWRCEALPADPRPVTVHRMTLDSLLTT